METSLPKKEGVSLPEKNMAAEATFMAIEAFIELFPGEKMLNASIIQDHPTLQTVLPTDVLLGEFLPAEVGLSAIISTFEMMGISLSHKNMLCKGAPSERDLFLAAKCQDISTFLQQRLWTLVRHRYDRPDAILELRKDFMVVSCN